LKHYTSKLNSYDDLSSLQTFGFRGEALSSLCALSKFHIITTRASEGPKGTKLEFEQSGKLKATSVVAAKQGTSVVVDSLFHNLPVRRKELEKTIKREYQKVLNLLNAYACISVGVKFSVSNQVTKGKKTVAFATQANPNTKENIANVYGAKTLLALIPLNLKFEMSPSNRPGANQSGRSLTTQEDSESREVKIVGHISRPVVGEGRQTPDRQMFFVNSRPCELPQVKKAFNEVYKSYNITQSAFIFADLKLDTNAYDVNVSPDKRSIMLHDQTALLESLKSALTELFEGHDQSVPQAQLLDRRIPAFKTPVIRQRESTDSAVEERALPRRTSDVPGKAQTEEESESSEPEEVARPGFVKASLIERDAGRDTEGRVIDHPISNRRSKSASAENQDTPVAAQQQKFGLSRLDRTEREASPLFEPENETTEPREERPRAVQDFSARIASQHAKQMAQVSSPKSADEEEEVEEEEEESIPAIKQTPRRNPGQSSIQNAFDRMRPMRKPAQQATITIGDTTIVSTVGKGSWTSSRSRVHIPKFSLSGTPLSQTAKKSSLVQKSLRGFIAPGTQLDDSEDEGESEDEEEDEEEEEDDDKDEDENSEVGSNILDAPRASSLPSARRRVSNSRSPSADEATDVSGPPGIPQPLSHEEEVEEIGADHQQQVEEASDEEYIDESEKKAREEAKISKMIAEAEETATRPTEKNLKRADKLLQTSRKTYRTINLVGVVETSTDFISQSLQSLEASLQNAESNTLQNSNVPSAIQLDPEERLSLTVSKSDFLQMRIIGQFNLGFILAVRPPSITSSTPDLFIIDQHASDEKYNFERFTTSTILEPQRLVHPHPLELTAIEEEIILNNEDALTKNGFRVDIDTSGDTPVGQRARLTSLPMSKEATFKPTDLEELLVLLLDNPPSSSTFSDKYIPRPSKVRKLLASRACRSSIMIGKTLRGSQMEKVVRHMGEMDKPWSCPHGRPTMRHLYGLDRWEGWKEGDGLAGLDGTRKETDWGRYFKKKRKGSKE
jgi:DNA mismatch repair protein PMS2